MAVLAIFDNARSKMPRWMKFFDHMVTGNVEGYDREDGASAVTRGLIEEGLESPGQDLVDAAGVKDVDDAREQSNRATVVPSSLLLPDGGWQEQGR